MQSEGLSLGLPDERRDLFTIYPSVNRGLEGLQSGPQRVLQASRTHPGPQDSSSMLIGRLSCGFAWSGRPRFNRHAGLERWIDLCWSAVYALPGGPLLTHVPRRVLQLQPRELQIVGDLWPRSAWRRWRGQSGRRGRRQLTGSATRLRGRRMRGRVNRLQRLLAEPSQRVPATSDARRVSARDLGFLSLWLARGVVLAELQWELAAAKAGDQSGAPGPSP